MMGEPWAGEPGTPPTAEQPHLPQRPTCGLPLCLTEAPILFFYVLTQELREHSWVSTTQRLSDEDRVLGTW